MTSAQAPRSIRVLPEEVANQIAAGEVIERPASVVKELVENALDAGATQVFIEIKGGGKELIRVRDDGHGVPAGEAALVFERHATSKIERAHDLTTITTLGFRGEALPSIASIARMEFVSRPATQTEAARIECVGGEVRQHVTGAPVGTQVSVYDLFYNTPARFKFLKTDATERRYIAELVTHLALAHYHVAFTLHMEGREVLRTPGTGRLLEAIAAVHGRSLLDELIPVEWDSPWAAIHGYVGTVKVAKGNRSGQSIFVNGRWVQSRFLNTAIERGYEALLAHRRYPLAILHLHIDPTLIDVNVHPAKTEIRFKDERETFKAVMLAVRKALTEANLVGTIAAPNTDSMPAGSELPDAQTPARQREDGPSQGRIAFHRAGGPSASGSSARPQETAETATWVGEVRTQWVPPSDIASSEETTPMRADVAATIDAPIVPYASAGQVSDLPASDARTSDPPTSDPPEPTDHARLGVAEGRAHERWEEFSRQAHARHGISPRELLQTGHVLGQWLNTYILLPVPDGLWFIDQHVAHERVLYEEVLRRDESDGSGLVLQELLVPKTLVLSPDLSAALDEHKELLASMGFIVEAFGPREYVVRAIPASLASTGGTYLVNLLEELVTLIEEGGPTLREQAAAMIACKGAIKAKQHLSMERMQHLLRRLAQTSNPYACPHGRPIILQLDRREIERRFGRS